MITQEEESDYEKNRFCFVLVGNIIDKHYFGEEKEIRRGTKHFSPGTKVYLFPEYGGNGYLDMHVYGLHRKSKRKILMVIRSYMIKNVRVKKTMNLNIRDQIFSSYFYSFLDNNEEKLNEFAESMNKENRKFSVELD